MAELIVPGTRFGLLAVTGRVRRQGVGQNLHYETLCDCGSPPKFRQGSNLRIAKSCGCASKARKHDASQTPVYSVWKRMKGRCYCPTDKSYPDYGGRGIITCHEWKSFEPFQEWALNSGYQTGLTLERIDNNSSYSPENCKWATRLE